VRKLFALFVLGSLSLAVGCGGSGGGSTPKGVPGAGSNVLSVVVDGGPTANQAGGALYPNGLFASATICVPGSTSNCVTVDHLLVDTGSYGLRVLDSEVASLNLPTLTAADGSTAYDCVAFADLSFLWGPVQQADVTLGGEVASSLPIQVISSNTSNPAIPASCLNGNTAGDENTQASLQANGILGIGLEPTDCFFEGGSACDPGSGVAIPVPAYYGCSGATCTAQYVSVANQVTNPVAAFSTDNDGVIVELPSVSGSAPTVTGSVIFGVGTESNNQVAATATVFTTLCNTFTTAFDGQTFQIVDPGNCLDPANQGSFIDSGSNGLFFPDVNNFLPICPQNTPVGDLSTFYCPTSLQNLSATNEDPNGTGATEVTNFSVFNAEDLFTDADTSGDAAFSMLGGTNPTGVGFDWGLPFFYGRNVYSTIDATSVPSNLPTPPWWAY